MIDMIAEYHRYHGDRKVTIVRKLNTPRYTDVYLVRLVNRAGERYSVVDMVSEDGAGKPYITELFSAPIEGEADMVRFAEEDDHATD